MKLTSPLASFVIAQRFGENPAYYARFLDNAGNPEKGHQGVDLKADHGTPVFAVHDGYAFHVGPDAHGGEGVYLRFQDEDGLYWTCIYWHLCSKDDPQYAPTVDGNGREVKQGDLLGYADNTGAPFESSGDHLHFGLAQTNAGGGFLNTGNGFNGCIDPLPFFNISHVFTVNLKYGDPASPELKELQLALQGLSLMPAGVFGPYGPQTKKAVAAFQAQHHILDDGTHFGPQTRAVINNVLGK